MSTLAGLHAQNIEGFVVDMNSNPIIGASIVDKDQHRIAITNEEGRFELTFRQNFIFGIEQKGYESSWFKMIDPDKKIYTIQLNYKYLDLPTMEVTVRKPEEALRINSVNIIDYIPTSYGIVTLKKMMGQYFVALDSISKEGQGYAFNYEKPISLYRDCLGNIHILGKQLVYQIYLTPDTFQLVDIASVEQFKEFLEPCVAQFGNNFVLRDLTMDNQRYDLTLYERDNGNKNFYTQIDTLTARTASEARLATHYLNYPGDFCIISGTINRALAREVIREQYPLLNPYLYSEDLANSTIPDLVGLARQYPMWSYPIDVRTFQLGKHVVVVDFETDSVSVFNGKGDFVQARKFNVDADVKEVWQDYDNGNLFLYSRAKGEYLLFQLDPLSGNTYFILNFMDFPNTKSEKVFNNWIYYREIENGFHGINRIPIVSR